MIGRYTNKILFLTWICLLIYETFIEADVYPSKTAFTVVLPIFLTIGILNTLVFWKFAYQIIFDLEKKNVTFFMFKKKKPIQLEINEISVFLMGFYVNIYFDNKSIYFHGYDDLELINFLEQNALPVKWNRAGRYLTKNLFKRS